ncbi:MAG: hypothetical protein IJ962_06665 [Clostridia bacterium]|nr:hypothetical protein [Clostridia bacterium]MBR3868934.1 hypothetical protein [Clostridia bacterium]
MEFFKKFKEKKKKKQASRGQFEKIVVGEKTLPVLNFYLFTSKEDSKRYIELAAMDELPDLHFSEVDMEVVLTTKKLSIKAGFSDAFSKGRFKIYKFEVLDIHEYYI